MNHNLHDSPLFYRIWWRRWQSRWTRHRPSQPLPLHRPPFSLLVHLPEEALPEQVRHSSLARRYLTLLRPINWSALPARSEHRAWPGTRPASPLPYLVAMLIKLDQKHRSLGQLVEFLLAHPEIVWLAGFPLVPDSSSPWGFDVGASVPSAKQFSRALRRWPNQWLQFLLDETVRAVQAALPADLLFGDVVAIDTKHLLAWVKENNAKAYIKEGRFDKDKQPAGDPDCRLGCKRKRNQGKSRRHADTTPIEEATPATALGVGIGEYYWGYASGIAATKVPGWGEFVLAEVTKPFDESDVSYFYPLMAEVERRLGRRPRYGTADAAFDAFYLFEYFHQAGGFAAIPLANRGTVRTFDEENRPICPAGEAMFLKGTFLNRTSLVVHERQRWWCPLLHPQPVADTCPVDHASWPKGGCKSTIAASIGARLRYQLDRDSDSYKAIYKQRTLCERLFSLALDLGIERPKLRNQAAIANQNTLIYILINLRGLQRLLAKKQQITQD